MVELECRNGIEEKGVDEDGVSPIDFGKWLA